MTEGKILGALWAFAVPMMLGGLFQDLYSMADMTIAGYTLGDHAIAALSAPAAIINMMNYAARGFNMGNSILISNAFGEGDMEKTKKTLIATIVLCVGYSVLFTALFLIFIEPLLNFVNTPAELYDDAKLYAVIVIAGLTCTMFYNVFACAFRALGNSKIPLYFLIFSSLLNIVLDYICIVFLRMGVMGAAAATIFSQFISAVLSGIDFFRVFPEMRFKLSDIKGTGCHRYVPRGYFRGHHELDLLDRRRIRSGCHQRTRSGHDHRPVRLLEDPYVRHHSFCQHRKCGRYLCRTELRCEEV